MAILRHIYRWRWGLVLLLVLGAQLLWQPAPVRAATCIVTTNADSGAGSLREKIADTNCSTINFNSNYTIVLSSELTISRNVTIDGAGHAITISGNNAVRVFYVNTGVTFNLSNLTVANGKVSSGNGGGIYNTGTLNVTNSTFSDNSAGGSGGGIFNTGTLNVSNSTFSGGGRVPGRWHFQWRHIQRDEQHRGEQYGQQLLCLLRDRRVEQPGERWHLRRGDLRPAARRRSGAGRAGVRGGGTPHRAPPTSRPAPPRRRDDLSQRKQRL